MLISKFDNFLSYVCQKGYVENIFLNFRVSIDVHLIFPLEEVMFVLSIDKQKENICFTRIKLHTVNIELIR